MPEDQTRKELMTKSDNYDQTRLCLLAFRQNLDFQYDSDFSFGKKMAVSEDNKVKDTCEKVTPDGVAEVDGEGVVLEVKKSIPELKEGREKIFRQLLVYDDNLEGWQGEVEKHDIICLTHDSNSRNLEDFLKELNSGESEPEIEDLQNAEDLEFDRPLVVVGFYRNDENSSYIAFKKERGLNSLSHDGLEEQLDEGLNVPLKYVVGENIKFYDERPPLPYLLHILWQHVFPGMIPADEYSASGNGQSIIEIDVELDELVARMRKTYGFRNEDGAEYDIPRKRWLKDAMNALSDMGHVRKKSDGEFVVRYWKVKSASSNMQDYFAEELSVDGDTGGLMQYYNQDSE